MTFWDFLVWSFWFYLVFVCITIFIRVFIDLVREPVCRHDPVQPWGGRGFEPRVGWQLRQRVDEPLGQTVLGPCHRAQREPLVSDSAHATGLIRTHPSARSGQRTR